MHHVQHVKVPTILRGSARRLGHGVDARLRLGPHPPWQQLLAAGTRPSRIARFIPDEGEAGTQHHLEDEHGQCHKTSVALLTYCISDLGLPATCLQDFGSRRSLTPSQTRQHGGAGMVPVGLGWARIDVLIPPCMEIH